MNCGRNQSSTIRDWSTAKCGFYILYNINWNFQSYLMKNQSTRNRMNLRKYTYEEMIRNYFTFVFYKNFSDGRQSYEPLFYYKQDPTC